MVAPPPMTYSDAKARIIRSITKLTSFVTAGGDYKSVAMPASGRKYQKCCRN